MPFIAIFGGTFNPFHIGHYEIIKALQNDSNIEKILVMPDKIPPHKVCDFIVDDTARIEMCSLVVNDFSKAELCLLEFEREGKSYTYDTVKILKREYPDSNFIFVCGADMFVIFEKWYKYQELMKELPFMVFKRSDTDEKLLNEYVKKLSRAGMDIFVSKQSIPYVSSTNIRKNFKKAQEFLPEPIFEYLCKRGLYV